MLMATSDDSSASIWNVPYGTTWPSTPCVTLYGHTNEVSCGAFLGDESHVVTGSTDCTLRIWRISDGVQVAIYKCGLVRDYIVLFLSLTPLNFAMQASLFSFTLAAKEVYALSYHAASGNIVVGLEDEVQVWQIAPYIAPHTARQAALPQAAPTLSEPVQVEPIQSEPVQAAPVQSEPIQAAPVQSEPVQVEPAQSEPPLPDHECVRERLIEAQTEAHEIEASLSKLDAGFRHHISREQELIRSIEDLETKCAHRISRSYSTQRFQ